MKKTEFEISNRVIEFSNTNKTNNFDLHYSTNNNCDDTNSQTRNKYEFTKIYLNTNQNKFDKIDSYVSFFENYSDFDLQNKNKYEFITNKLDANQDTINKLLTYLEDADNLLF